MVDLYFTIGRDGNHNYNWMDYTTTRSCKYAPCDTHGHGSHVVGTMVGGEPNQIVGVAPEAEFIACRPDLGFDAVPWTK